MSLTLNSALWLLLVAVAVFGVIGVVSAFREKLGELERRAARQAEFRTQVRHHLNPDRAARRSKPA